MQGKAAHLKRWVTAVMALPVVFFVVGPGPEWLFTVFILVVALLGIEEFYSNLIPDLPSFIKLSGHVLTVFFFGAIFIRQIMILPLITLLWAFIPMTYLMLAKPSHSPQWTAMTARATLGPIYVAFPLAMLTAIRMRPNGHIWIFFLLAVVFATDTGAFYCGRIFGRHRLYEAISPKKTWEGAIGGTVLSLLVSGFFIRLFPVLNLFPALVIAMGISIAGQIGDLAESMLKRHHGVKDSGSLLPGHGGILDRIDSILFASPMLYLALVFL